MTNKGQLNAKHNRTVDVIKLALSFVIPVSALLGIGIAWGVLSARVDASWAQIERIQADQIRIGRRLDLIEQRMSEISADVSSQKAILESIAKNVDYILARVDQLTTP